MKEIVFKDRLAKIGDFWLIIYNKTSGDDVRFSWSINVYFAYPHGVRIGSKPTEAEAEEDCRKEFRKLIEPTKGYC